MQVQVRAPASMEVGREATLSPRRAMERPEREKRRARQQTAIDPKTLRRQLPDQVASKSSNGRGRKRLKRGLSLSISYFRLPRRSSPPPPMPIFSLAPTGKDDASSSSAISDASTPNCTPIIYNCSEDCAYATPCSKVPMKPNEVGSSSQSRARGLRSSKSIGRAWKSLRRWRSLGDRDSRSSKERDCEAAGIPPVPPLPSLPASALIADRVVTARDTYSLETLSCEGTKEVLVISTPSPTHGSPDSKDASGMQETQGQRERLTFPKVLPVRRVMASLVLRPRSSGRSK
ncbi:hypothetical protein DFH11DRAFT_490510 [Phellopilus nigrolimitatus]|nr:hypothetical protein DFH11DRAFT_490510 [Phellopilus nigrolimitatus]